jgi:uncharacterized protein YyaL (SSP411 family)
VKPAPPRPPNHLDGQTSPYLLQHRLNPVDWYPWGPEALGKAQAEDKPIFLSIGYAACHWCHVMERESFEDETVAALLNESFVSIKVDREERPDLDEVYMTAVQMLTGQGGWPLNVFLTPDAKPFFGGTYFPPDERYGRRPFSAVLGLIRDAWRERRADVTGSAAEIAAHIAAASRPSAGATAERLGRDDVTRAISELAARFDAAWGGFSPAPKFPPHAAVRLILSEHARTGDASLLTMARTTLDRMARGGLYDQFGGGFARYSTDERWLVPHFEKMLYDQALLVPVYVDAWRATGDPSFRRVVLETADFVRRELTGPEGGLYASLDADSGGHEGSFYVWTPEDVAQTLGPDGAAAIASVYDITPRGNFEGSSIPNLLKAPLTEELNAKLAPLRAKLLEARGARVRPATDDKVLTSWNGLMISAFAKAYEAFGREDDLRSARRAADFVRNEMSDGDRLRVSWREGKAHLNAYLDDYAFTARAAIDLYEAAFDPRDLAWARALAGTLLSRFSDGSGGFHFTSDDHEAILARTSSVYDGAIPAGSAVAAEALARLAVHLDDRECRAAFEGVLEALAPSGRRGPAAVATLLAASAYADGPVVTIAVVGPEDDERTQALLAAARSVPLPARALAWCDPALSTSDLPLLAGKTIPGGRPAAFVCRDMACDPPVFDAAALRSALVRR